MGCLSCTLLAPVLAHLDAAAAGWVVPPAMSDDASKMSIPGDQWFGFSIVVVVKKGAMEECDRSVRLVFVESCSMFVQYVQKGSESENVLFV